MLWYTGLPDLKSMRDPSLPANRLASIRRWWTHPFAIAAVLLVATVLFRSAAGLASAPPGLFGDEATDGLDALDVLAGHGAIFFPANFGREGLHMWIVAAMFRWFGVTPEAVRLPSYVAGLLTVLATYWLGRELIHATRRSSGDIQRSAPWLPDLIPVAAALYTATSFWHLHFSRFGIRGVFTPLCGALAFTAFWRGVNRNSVRWFALSGLFLGLATHFYTAARFLPLFLGAFLLVQGAIALLRHRQEDAILLRNFKGIVVLYGVALLIFLPLGIYFLQHPGSFSQRAGEVVAFGASKPWARMGQAALANVLQFFVPGKGDVEQFYNLPGRAVFEPVTAVLALIGIVALLIRFRQAPALFLLLWFPALLLPSFLATDRWPTLPRVLGVIPGVYFFPAVGLTCVAGLGWFLARRVPQWRRTWLPAAAAGVLMVVLLAAHGATTWRDYFRIWAPSQATFDAFEGDMTAAWRWLAANPQSAHVYLSSDIYRHPTYMLLGEHVSVQTLFEHRNPGLSWFDGRYAMPLPPDGAASTYLFGASAVSPPEAMALLPEPQGREEVAAPDGSAALSILTVPARASISEDSMGVARNASSAVAFSPLLYLEGAALKRTAEDAPEIRMQWSTVGPDAGNWAAYRLQIATPDGVWQMEAPFEAFRPPEWVAGGRFLTWQRVDGMPGVPVQLRLRLISQADGMPVVTPDAPDGWHTINLN